MEECVKKKLQHVLQETVGNTRKLTEAHISATKNLSYQEETSLGKKKTNPKDNKKCTPQRSLHKSHQSVQDYIHKKRDETSRKKPQT